MNEIGLAPYQECINKMNAALAPSCNTLTTSEIIFSLKRKLQENQLCQE